jgi:hypothetical protein
LPGFNGIPGLLPDAVNEKKTGATPPCCMAHYYPYYVHLGSDIISFLSEKAANLAIGHGRKYDATVGEKGRLIFPSNAFQW